MKKYKTWKNFMIGSSMLFIFFVFSYFHDWANGLAINLHFCNHTLCMWYSLLFLVFAFIGYNNYRKKKKFKDSIFISVLIVLGVGIILMNMITCVGDNMYLGDTELFTALPYKTTPIPVPNPPCVETDAGMDYITYGEIRSSVDIGDICMGETTLRERYCDSELTYTSIDIKCVEEFGVGWICEEGECREGEIPDELEACYDACDDEAYEYCREHALEGTDEFDYCLDSREDEIAGCIAICDGEDTPISKEDTLELCTDEVDNDRDGLVDCDDVDCAEFCECAHDCDPITGCFGYCDWDVYSYDGYCAEYVTLGASWCECVPNEEVPCGDVEGWCVDEDMCVPTPDGSYICVYDYGYPCYESDGGFMPTVGGYCYSFVSETFEYDECVGDEWSRDLMELSCVDFGCNAGQGYCDSCIDAEGGDYC